MKETIKKLQQGETLINGKKQLSYNENTLRYVVTGGNKTCDTISVKDAINYFNE